MKKIKKKRIGKEVKSVRAMPFERTPIITREMVDKESRTIKFTMSSEQPVDQWFGREILDHKNKSIRLDRFKDGANLLLDHDPRKVIGVVEDVAIDAGSHKASVIVRFSENPLASEVWADVVTGIRRNVSVGYRIHEMILEKQSDEDKDTYRVTDWEPFEVSMVGIAADQTVGVDREIETENDIVIRRTQAMKKCSVCGEIHEVNERGLCTKCEATRAAQSVAPATPATTATPAAPDVRTEPVASVEDLTRLAKDAEVSRQKDIASIGAEFKQEALARTFIDGDKTVNEFREAVLKALGATQAVETPAVGMTPRDLKKYSLCRMILSQSDPSVEAGFEREISQDVAKLAGRAPKGLFVPFDVVSEKRDLNTTTDSQGGYTVATDLLSMIEKLENTAMVMRLGATVFNGLVGDIAIPRQTGGATAYWLTNESTEVTESTPAFDQLALSPKTIGALSEYTRDFLLQSTLDAENFLRNDLALRLSLGIDLAAINGSGSAGQPTGILNTSGIGDVALGTDGGVMTWAKFVQLWSEVAQDNAAFGSTGFLTNAKVHGALMDTEKASDTGLFIAKDFPMPDGMTSYSGARAAVSNQVPSNLTKGNGTDLSALVYGNWADWIIAMWGGLDILSNPFTKQSTRIVSVSAFQSVDMKARHAASFSASQDIITG